ncbi:GNAT family N-acetyltransferase [Kocuria tytonis]|uniref:GNAT family N-acetyltransferase n=1 Tax=Kocuria tytonis TaxID=2054280 RepID=A0A495A9V6_9MICC|nr:GNAT family N-acetyltransferase [Kocuria tytonis]RKQ36837.1 GNAT family N-acetyltransferase [Kocuria tytonis]
MPSDLLRLSLAPTVSASVDRQSSQIGIRPLEAVDTAALAEVYFDSYPRGVAVDDVGAARKDIESTFCGDYGRLRLDASASAWRGNRLVGAVMVVERSIWDKHLDGPFIIELFVSPSSRRVGAGRALLQHAIATCVAAGDPALSLRFGEGTSSAAMKLYHDLGFITHPGS